MTYLECEYSHRHAGYTDEEEEEEEEGGESTSVECLFLITPPAWEVTVPMMAGSMPRYSAPTPSLATSSCSQGLTYPILHFCGST